MPAPGERARDTESVMGLGKSGLQLSGTQVIASVLAAVTATVAGSFLGVNGTIIGAAVASVVTVVGNAVYSHSLHRTRDRVLTAPAVRRIAPIAPRATVSGATGGTPATPPVDEAHRAVGRGALQRGGLAAAGVFLALLTALTTVEVVTGRPLSDLLHGKPASGTTVFGSSQQPVSAVPSQPAPVTVTQTVVPKVVTTTPTVTQTAPAVTVTPAPTATPSSSQTASPSATPTGPATP